MNQITNTDPTQLKLKYMQNELQGLRTVIEYLYDGNQGAFNALYFIKSNYKQWPEMIKWLKDNKLKGKLLVEFFQNESPDGGGYHMGATKIISMMEAKKHYTRTIKIDELR